MSLSVYDCEQLQPGGSEPPLFFAKQITLLESRGMAIPDHARALRYLSHINYYRLRAYRLPFETNTGTEHSFSPGTTFDSVLTLYVLTANSACWCWRPSSGLRFPSVLIFPMNRP